MLRPAPIVYSVIGARQPNARTTCIDAHTQHRLAYAILSARCVGGHAGFHNVEGRLVRDQDRGTEPRRFLLNVPIDIAAPVSIDRQCERVFYSRCAISWAMLFCCRPSS